MMLKKLANAIKGTSSQPAPEPNEIHSPEATTTRQESINRQNDLLDQINQRLGLLDEVQRQLQRIDYGQQHQIHSNRLESTRQLIDVIEERQRLHPNRFTQFGAKCFSQSDEDGLTLEILRRLGLRRGTFIEFGIGDGTENNTLVLLSLGWSGSWFGGQDIAFDATMSKRLNFEKTWITNENIDSLVQHHFNQSTTQEIDLVSLDLDGNDFYLCQSILESGVHPKVFIVEYNAKFPPPVEFCIQYNPEHTWNGDDYFGASLQSFCKLFGEHGYFLVCCNAASGSNAFFVKANYASYFRDVPKEIEKIYVAPYYFIPTQYGHKPSLATIKRILE